MTEQVEYSGEWLIDEIYAMALRDSELSVEAEKLLKALKRVRDNAETRITLTSTPTRNNWFYTMWMKSVESEDDNGQTK